MQRRAAAIYVALFLVIGAGSYSLIATAHEPTISFQNPDYALQQNDTFSVGNQQYTVTTITAEMSGGGGHGGGQPELTRSGEITWLNESARHTATLENNSTAKVDNTTYLVLVSNQTGGSNQFTLREEINQTQVLQNDSQADNQTVMRNGESYVIVEDESGNASLVPADQYFGEPETRQYSQGDSLVYDGNQSTVKTVDNSSVTLAWTKAQNETVELNDEGNVTLHNETYLAYFPSNDTVYLTQNFQHYNEQSHEIEEFHTERNGLWGVFALCIVSAVLLAAIAYLPSRY